MPKIWGLPRTDCRRWPRLLLNFRRARPSSMASCAFAMTEGVLAFHAEMRQPRADVSRMAFFAFDMMFEGGVDLRSQSLSQRQNDLARACGKGREPIPHLFLSRRRAAS